MSKKIEFILITIPLAALLFYFIPLKFRANDIEFGETHSVEAIFNYIIGFPAILIPIISGAIFPRKFICKYNFYLIFKSLFIVSFLGAIINFVRQYKELLDDWRSIYLAIFENIFQILTISLIIASLYGLISFISSTVFSKKSNILSVQLIFASIPKKVILTALFTIYFWFVVPFVYFELPDGWSAYGAFTGEWDQMAMEKAYEGDMFYRGLLYYSIIIWEIIAALVAYKYLKHLYRTTLNLNKINLVNNAKDYMTFAFILVVPVVTLMIVIFSDQISYYIFNLFKTVS